MITPYKPVDIEVLESNYMLYKVLTRGQESPAKFTIDIRRGNEFKKKVDLRVYLSATVREPTESKCDKAVTNVRFSGLSMSI
jgi:hypothetical protein